MKTCCICGDYVPGQFRQWHNRDDGYSICERCVIAEIAEGTPADVMKDYYGVAGVHYPAPKTGECG